MFSITVACGSLADNDSSFDIRLEVLLGFSWSSRVDLRPGSDLTVKHGPKRTRLQEVLRFT